jgi:hypothetical protein
MLRRMRRRSRKLSQELKRLLPARRFRSLGRFCFWAKSRVTMIEGECRLVGSSVGSKPAPLKNVRVQHATPGFDC